MAQRRRCSRSIRISARIRPTFSPRASASRRWTLHSSSEATAKRATRDGALLMAKRAGATVVEVAGSHAIYVSQPAAVARLIVEAARGERAMASSG